MPKKYITVQLEVDYEVDENYDTTEFKYAEIIDSVLPVFVDPNDLSQAELFAVYDYLRHGEDADFNLMWDLKSLIREEIHP